MMSRKPSGERMRPITEQTDGIHLPLPQEYVRRTPPLKKASEQSSAVCGACNTAVNIERTGMGERWYCTREACENHVGQWVGPDYPPPYWIRDLPNRNRIR